MGTFQNWSNKFHSNSGSKKITSPRFHEVPLFTNNTWTSKIKKRTLRGLYFAFNALLKNFNILTFFCKRYETLLLTEKKIP